MNHARKTKDQLIGQLKVLEDEWRQAQQTIQARDRLYRLLVENSLGLICSHDLDGVLLSINPAAAASLGYRPEDGIGHNLREFLAPTVRPLFDEYLDRIRQNGSDSGFMRLVARDGGERVWLYRNVRYDEPGAPSCVLGHAQDITETIAAKEALERARDDLAARVAQRTAELERSNALLQVSEARFRALTEHATDLIAVLGEDLSYLYASPSHLRILGYTPEQLVGQDALDIVHPDDRAEILQAFTEGITAPEAEMGAAPAIELRARHADGTWHTLAATASNRLSDPAVGGVIANAHDITTRKQAEDERAALLVREQEARAQIEAALRARDEFLTAAAHDLRTPLTVISGYIDMIRMALESKNERAGTLDWLRQRLAPVALACSRMIAAVDEIADAAQLQMGQDLMLRTETVEVGEMVRAAIATIEAGPAPGRSIVIVEADGPSIVSGDRLRLERVMHNIIGNAVKYSPKGTPIQVSIRRQGQSVVITVQDRGVGIPHDELPRIFEQFYRASTSAGIPGMGIGLAGARAIVAQHNGQITAASTVGQGTTVTVTLPVAVSP